MGGLVAIRTEGTQILPMLKDISVRELFRAMEQPEASRGWFLTVAISWKEYTRRALLTATVDFGCAHNGTTCAMTRKNPSYESKRKPGTACCYNCQNSYGNLRVIRPGTSGYYARLFDWELGFWRPGRGCILPRPMRSDGCLGWQCYEQFSKVRTELIMSIGEIRLKQPNEK